MALMCNPCNAFLQRPTDASQHRIGEPRRHRAPSRQLVGKSKNVMPQRVHSALVALRQKLGFVSRHTHLHRTLRLAGFATEAQVKRLMYSMALVTLAAQIAGQHLPQQMCTSARGVLLLHGGAIARTHDAAVRLAARAYTDASFRGPLKRTAIRRERKMRLRHRLGMSRLDRSQIARPKTKILPRILPFNRIP